MAYIPLSQRPLDAVYFLFFLVSQVLLSTFPRPLLCGFSWIFQTQNTSRANLSPLFPCVYRFTLSVLLAFSLTVSMTFAFSLFSGLCTPMASRSYHLSDLPLPYPSISAASFLTYIPLSLSKNSRPRSSWTAKRFFRPLGIPPRSRSS